METPNFAGNKIAAIKFLREMILTLVKTTTPSTVIDTFGRQTITFIVPSIGLKAAKDFVEACMALNEVKATKFWTLTRHSVRDQELYTHEPLVLGHFLSYSSAERARDRRIDVTDGTPMFETTYDFNIVEHSFSL